MKLRRVCVRVSIRVSQQTKAVMKSVQKDYIKRIMTAYANLINNPKLLVNIDETAVCKNCSPNLTVHDKGERTVSIRIGSSSSKCYTMAATVAMDGTKIPLFVIFKAKSSGLIERTPANNLPEGVVGCV